VNKSARAASKEKTHHARPAMTAGSNQGVEAKQSMLIYRKLMLGLLAILAIGAATPAQARHYRYYGRHHVNRYYDPRYGNYAYYHDGHGPTHNYWGNEYYGNRYYGNRYYGSRSDVTIGFGGSSYSRSHHRHHHHH
jgi:hypothetical protein